MKRLGLLLLLVLFGMTLLGCSDLGLTTIDPANLTTEEVTTDKTTTTTTTTTNLPTGTEVTEEITYQDKIFVGSDEGCDGSENYIVVGGECVYMEDILSPQIVVTESEINVTYENGIELMDDLIADLSGSTGLAVVPREIYINQRDLNQERRSSLLNVTMTLEDEVTSNIIVKLKEDGFFEEVSFSDSTGYTVNITSNPLALEVFGDYTVIIFEVDFGYQDDQRNFEQRLYDSLYSGGMYLIHNETGKLFPTSDVSFNEETWVGYEYEYETIITTANANEPVTHEVVSYLYDEFGDPILDEFGEPTFEMIDEIILDENGDEIIFEDGPIVTETQQFPKSENFLVLMTDDQGEAVLDEFGQPVYEEITEPVLDSNGNQVYYEEEVAVLDEFGEVIYQTDFEVEISVRIEIEKTETVYHAEIQQGPLFELSKRFVERVMDNYFNWNYSRLFNYNINYGFAESGDMIYYVDEKFNETSDTNERFIMRLSFDAENTELVLEEIMNMTKGGFLNGDLILDPVTGIILYKNYAGEENIKAYSPTLGLKTIADSKYFDIKIFPNDELFLVDRQTQYIEALGYDTTVIYSLNADATLTEHYIELGVIPSINNWQPYFFGFTSIIYDEDGNPISDYQYGNYVEIQIELGDQFITDANLQIVSVGDINPARVECSDVNGCLEAVEHDFYLGEVYVGSGYQNVRYYPGDTPPPYKVSYQLQENTTVNYGTHWVQEDSVCDNEELGCNDNIGLFDQIGTHQISLWNNFIVSFGDRLVSEIRTRTNNNIQYEYTKTEYSNVCEVTECQSRVKLEIYDLDGILFASEWHDQTYYETETIPLIIEYRMSENSTLVEGSVCSTNNGCDQNYNTPEGMWYWVRYEYGQQIYNDIQFVNTDRSEIYEKTYVRETCSELSGCSADDVNYIINDSEGNLLYEFTENMWAEYGEKLPYKATATIDDVEIVYQTVGSEEPFYCEETSCTENLNIIFVNSNGDHDYIAQIPKRYALGERIIYDYIVDSTLATPFETNYNRTCNYQDGCNYSTSNFTILDEDGNEFILNDENEHYIEYYFEYGEEMSYNDEFSVVYQLRDVVYQTDRVNANYAINNMMDSFTMLDDNIFYIKEPSWSQAVRKYILKYDEVNDTYFAAFTNLPYMYEIKKLGDGYIGINNDKTAIYYFELDASLSNENYYHYNLTNLTENQEINAVNNLIIDYDGSIYFEAVDNFIQEITGKIAEDGSITIDTVFTEYEIIRVRPIN